MGEFQNNAPLPFFLLLLLLPPPSSFSFGVAPGLSCRVEPPSAPRDELEEGLVVLEDPEPVACSLGLGVFPSTSSAYCCNNSR